MRFSVWRLLLLTGWVGLLLFYLKIHGWDIALSEWSNESFVLGFQGHDATTQTESRAALTVGLLLRFVLEVAGLGFMAFSFCWSCLRKPPKVKPQIPEHDWVI